MLLRHIMQIVEGDIEGVGWTGVLRNVEMIGSCWRMVGDGDASGTNSTKNNRYTSPEQAKKHFTS